LPHRTFRVGRVMKHKRTTETDMQKIRNFIRNSKGATAIEYGLIAALIAVAAIAAMQGLGNQLNKTFGNVTSNMKAS
jgi:pilus assembly protein Flp/PilA